MTSIPLQTCADCGQPSQALTTFVYSPHLGVYYAGPGICPRCREVRYEQATGREVGNEQ